MANPEKIYLNRKGKYATIDSSSLPLVAGWRWYYDKGYARGYKGGKKVYMHRLIVQTPEGSFTDHINRDKLDNRLSNLRICTNSQNQYNKGLQVNNSSGFPGIRYRKDRQKFEAYIRTGSLIFLGRFNTLQEALGARFTAEEEFCGGFAR